MFSFSEMAEESGKFTLESKHRSYRIVAGGSEIELVFKCLFKPKISKSDKA